MENKNNSLFYHPDWATSVLKRKRMDQQLESLGPNTMFAYPTWAESFTNEKPQPRVPVTTNNWNQFSGIPRTAAINGGKTRFRKNRKTKQTKKTKRSRKSRTHKK